MTVNERAERAVQFKHNGCNCCQAVASVFDDIIDADRGFLQQLGSGFGAGMGCMEATCGALCGAVMIAGLAKNGRGTVMVSRTILNDFETACGATICKDLKQRINGKPRCDCDDCVRNAVKATCKLLQI